MLLKPHERCACWFIQGWGQCPTASLVSVLFWCLNFCRCFSRRRHEFHRQTWVVNLQPSRSWRAVESIPGKVTLYIYMLSNFYKGSSIGGFFCFPWFFSRNKWEKKPSRRIKKSMNRATLINMICRTTKNLYASWHDSLQYKSLWIIS